MPLAASQRCLGARRSEARTRVRVDGRGRTRREEGESRKLESREILRVLVKIWSVAEIGNRCLRGASESASVFEQAKRSEVRRPTTVTGGEL